MCLSNVYLEKKEQNKLVIEEAEQVNADGENVQVKAFFWRE